MLIGGPEPGPLCGFSTLISAPATPVPTVLRISSSDSNESRSRSSKSTKLTAIVPSLAPDPRLPLDPTVETTDSKSARTGSATSSRSTPRTTSSVASARVPGGSSTCTYTVSGGMSSGKNSIPALNIPNSRTEATSVPAIPPITRPRWASAQRNRRS